MPKNCECEHSSHFSIFFEQDMGCSGLASVVKHTIYGDYHICAECEKHDHIPKEYLK